MLKIPRRKYEMRKDAREYAKRDQAPRWEPPEGAPERPGDHYVWDPGEAVKPDARFDGPARLAPKTANNLGLDLREPHRPSARERALLRRQMRRL